MALSMSENLPTSSSKTGSLVESALPIDWNSCCFVRRLAVFNVPIIELLGALLPIIDPDTDIFGNSSKSVTFSPKTLFLRVSQPVLTLKK
mmetsp:Transcript_26226/g.43816  ORF Transcript_26226/g.43816 Transcript_26226/m.43816 type:complete len:90 (-) Transcript_26226:12-281(-)